MYCPKCGHKIEDNQNFCGSCGNDLTTNELTHEIGNTTYNKIMRIFSVLFLVLFIGSGLFYLFGGNIPKSANYDLSTPSQVLAKIDELQTEYFTLIKRNDVLLVPQAHEFEEDQEELDTLFDRVKNNIDHKNPYYQEYLNIEQEYANNDGETTQEVNYFAQRHYDAVDKLLNETYQAVRAKIPQEDFKQLIQSELAWLREVEAYHKVYEKQEYGTIRTLMNYNYEINMRNFRTLLLMLYL